ncbi:hypothetical protein F4859DRAFT_205157 [Xylaria cf. heliscus]|nr:hypothetical protein F4859DRAFT_205157 [Xylaria cf. heliscus]
MNIEKSPIASETTAGSVRRSRKRERYTRVACNVCKARKVKCSGVFPCSRCVELKVECRYHLANAAYANAQHERSTTRLLGAPRRDLAQLLSTMKQICADIELSTSEAGITHSRASLLKRRRFHIYDGRPRSKHAHSTTMNTLWPALRLVQEFLEDHKTVIPNGNSQDAATQMATKETTQYPDVSAITLQAAKPLLDMGCDEVLRNLEIFEHNIFVMYPCFHMDIARERIETIFAQCSPSTAAEPRGLDMDLIDIELVKVSTAIAMLIRADDDNPLILDVEKHLVWNVDDIMKNENVQIEDVIMAIFMTIFFGVKNELVKSWRMCGLASRLCLELGLHKQVLHTDGDGNQEEAEILADIFNCVYDIDRTIGFTTAMPFSLRDEDISESAFDLDGRHPYLSTMVRVDRVLGEIMALMNSSPGPGRKEIDERLEFLAYRLEKIVENVQDVTLFPAEILARLPPTTQVVMQQIIAIRITHARMLARIKCVKDLEAFSCRSQSAHSLVSLAISSIDQHQKVFSTISEIGATRAFRFLLERLLGMSVSVLIAAASYNPQVYAPKCRSAFHTALDLLTTFQSQGPSTIISCSLAKLRKIGERIHMPAIVVPGDLDGCQIEETSLSPSSPVYTQFDFLEPCTSADHEFSSLLGNPSSNWEPELSNNEFIEAIMKPIL